MISPTRKDHRGVPWRSPSILSQKDESSHHDGLDSKYPEDDYSEAMGPNARVRKVYLDEDETEDSRMLGSWKDTVDVLLVFAGLFSAVVTSFPFDGD